MVGCSSWFVIVLDVAAFSGPRDIMVDCIVAKSAKGHEGSHVTEILSTPAFVVKVVCHFPAYLTVRMVEHIHLLRGSVNLVHLRPTLAYRS
jgi:hypothetical protein